MSANPELLCPTTDQECPALKNLHNLYVGNEESVEHDVATRDRVIYTAKYIEMRGAATIRACAGPDEGVCPTREGMDESIPRQTLVGVIRKLRAR